MIDIGSNVRFELMKKSIFDKNVPKNRFLDLLIFTLLSWTRKNCFHSIRFTLHRNHFSTSVQFFHKCSDMAVHLFAVKTKKNSSPDQKTQHRRNIEGKYVRRRSSIFTDDLAIWFCVCVWNYCTMHGCVFPFFFFVSLEFQLPNKNDLVIRNNFAICSNQHQRPKCFTAMKVCIHRTLPAKKKKKEEETRYKKWRRRKWVATTGWYTTKNNIDKMAHRIFTSTHTHLHSPSYHFFSDCFESPVHGLFSFSLRSFFFGVFFDIIHSFSKIREK